jgi:hypothetical protein
VGTPALIGLFADVKAFVSDRDVEESILSAQKLRIESTAGF